MKVWKTKERGFQITEAVVAVAVFSLAGLTLLSVYGAFFTASTEAKDNIRAAFLGEEGLEAIRSIRDDSFNGNISPLSGVGSRYLYFDSVANKWRATTTAQIEDGMFYRTFTVSPVYRDANNDIAVSGTEDPNIKKIIVSVAWNKKEATTTKSFTSYLSDIFDD